MLYPHGNEVVTELLRLVALTRLEMALYQPKRKA